MTVVSQLGGPDDPGDAIDAPVALVVVPGGPLPPAEVARLCNSARAQLLAGSQQGIVCDLRGTADLSVIDAVARLALIAADHQGRLWLRNVSADFAGLLVLTGLDDVLGLGLEPSRQPEAGKQGGVEEVVDVPDPTG
jgi:hypothetical protein